jgi:hypothetical protein
MSEQGRRGGVVPEQKVDITPIKRFVARAFPVESALKTVILGESDRLPKPVFLARMSVWLALLNLEAPNLSLRSRGYTTTILPGE